MRAEKERGKKREGKVAHTSQQGPRLRPAARGDGKTGRRGDGQPGETTVSGPTTGEFLFRIAPISTVHPLLETMSKSRRREDGETGRRGDGQPGDTGIRGDGETGRRGDHSNVEVFWRRTWARHPTVLGGGARALELPEHRLGDVRPGKVAAASGGALVPRHLDRITEVEPLYREGPTGDGDGADSAPGLGEVGLDRGWGRGRRWWWWWWLVVVVAP